MQKESEVEYDDGGGGGGACKDYNVGIQQSFSVITSPSFNDLMTSKFYSLCVSLRFSVDNIERRTTTWGDRIREGLVLHRRVMI